MTENRGRKPMLTIEQAVWAKRQQLEGKRMSWITGQLGVSRHVVYSAFKRHHLVEPVKETK